MNGNQPDDRDRSFESAYAGRPPWELGRAQPAFVALADDSSIPGDVLDVGCGSGENSLMLAKRGYDVLGVDTATVAIDRARTKARERGLDAEFRVHDAYDLAALGTQVDTIIDSGLFHVLVREDPQRYAASLRSVLRPGGRLFVLGFDAGTDGQGPGIAEAEIRDAFTDGWRVETIDPSVFETVDPGKYKRRGWLATIRATERGT